MENYIKISNLNDFIFCPKSIYFHELYGKYNHQTYQSTDQIIWKNNHISIDNKDYSTSQNVIQSLAIFSDKYQLVGKIDLYHIDKKSLIERKTYINKIYDGYKYQLYAQYFCMIEMWYEIDKMQIYSLKDNKSYIIQIPNQEEISKFEDFIKNYKEFDICKSKISINPEKCKKCIYSELCDTTI